MGASSATDERSLSVSRIGAVPRGGAEEESSDKMEEETEAETEILYLPGLLDVDLISVDQPTAVSDSAILLSAAKAKELGVSNGEVVAVVGRRRSATYGRVQVQK